MHKVIVAQFVPLDVQRQDVLVTGSGSVVDQLVAADPVDEFRLPASPIVLGKGRRVFELGGSEDAGVLRQTYARKAH